MSRKYVPTFLKEQQAESLNAGRSPGFSALSEDIPMNRKQSLYSHTSDQMPSVFGKPETNTFVPKTLASLTATNGTKSSSKKSFASKFTDRQKQIEEHNVKPSEKSLDFKSEDDFPTLCGFGTKNTIVNKEENIVVLPPVKKSGYADLARGLAKKKEEEEAMELQSKHYEDIKRRKPKLMKTTIIRHPFKTSSRKYDDYEDEENEDDVFTEYSSVSEGRGVDEFISEDNEDQDGELNPSTTYNRRHKEDLY